MQGPVHHVAWCQTDTQKEHGILLAACGPTLVTASLKDGSRLSSWSNVSSAAADDEPPTKKRKTGGDGPSSPAHITLLHLTNSHSHAVAVTGEDKCVHVFAVHPDGHLEHLSRRSMAKRPSALAVTPDDASVLVADKFGDVYLLPLLPDAEREAAFVAAQDASAAAAQQAPYRPAATALTVHSKRNRKALEQQLQRKAEPAKTKEPLRFAHQLLLGHVSVLTDVLSARVRRGGGKHRDYIVTADRDEHIRVSRGFPQAHVIEGFCLGHVSFVSKLCLVTEDVLVSGDGDGYLCVWDWVDARLRKKMDISNALPGKHGEDAGTHGRAAILGLWTYPSDGEARLLLVACEGHDTLWQVAVEDLLSGDAEPQPEGLDLGGNIIDLAVCGDKVIVTRDTYHIARTMDEPREEAAKQELTRLCMLQYSEHSGRFTEIDTEADHTTNDLIPRLEDALKTDGSSSWTEPSLYGLHSLRKRGGEEAGEDPT